MWMEAVVPYFKKLFQNLPGETKKINENSFWIVRKLTAPDQSSNLDPVTVYGG
jgi:hypothetical protein